MREIKFRAWDPERKHYCQVKSLKEFACAKVFDQEAALAQWERLIPEQFTGLLDENGVEIYEGDIIQQRHPISDIGAVEWIEDDARFGVNSRKTRFYDLKHINRGRLGVIKVIGNVHENADLLPVEKP